MPASRLSCSSRNVNGRGGSGSEPAMIGVLASPPHSSRISRVAYSMPGRTIAGSTPRSKRVRASLSIPRRRPFAAVRLGSNSAISSTTSVVVAVQPVLSPPMMPPRLMAPERSAITVTSGSSSYVLPSSASSRSPGRREAQDEVAAQLGRIEHVQRPPEVHGDEIGDVDQGRDRAQADRGESLLQPGRARAIPETPEHAADEQRARRLLARWKVERDLEGWLERPRHRRELSGSQLAEPGRRQLARDTEHAEAVAAVRRDRDLDHRALYL